jgi:hypothetical protein
LITIHPFKTQAESRDASFHPLLHGCWAKTEEFSDFDLSPAGAVHEDDGDPLLIRKRRQGGHQARLDPRILDNRTFEDRAPEANPGSALTNTVKKPNRVAHTSQPLLMLECPAERFGRSFSSALGAVGSDERSAQPRLDVGYKPLELGCVAHAPPWSLLPVLLKTSERAATRHLQEAGLARAHHPRSSEGEIGTQGNRYSCRWNCVASESYR